MLKIKTVRSAAKRFKKVGKNNLKHKRANLRHLLTKKTSKRRRQLRQKAIVSKRNLDSIIACLPYTAYR